MWSHRVKGPRSVGACAHNVMRWFHHPAHPTLLFQKLFGVAVHSIGFTAPALLLEGTDSLHTTGLYWNREKYWVHRFTSASLAPLIRTAFLFVSGKRGSERAVAGLRSGPSEIAVRRHNTAECFPLLCETYTDVRPVTDVSQAKSNWPQVEVFDWNSSFVCNTPRIRISVWKQFIGTFFTNLYIIISILLILQIFKPITFITHFMDILNLD
jgi:hypothetical protein